MYNITRHNFEITHTYCIYLTYIFKVYSTYNECTAWEGTTDAKTQYTVGFSKMLNCHCPCKSCNQSKKEFGVPVVISISSFLHSFDFFHLSSSVIWYLINFRTSESPPVALFQLMIDDMLQCLLIPMYMNHLSVMFVSTLTSSTQSVYHYVF